MEAMNCAVIDHEIIRMVTIEGIDLEFASFYPITTL